MQAMQINMGISPEHAAAQYDRLADAILMLNTMVERIRIIESEPERSRGMRQLLVDNDSAFYVIQGDKVIVTGFKSITGWMFSHFCFFYFLQNFHAIFPGFRLIHRA